MTYLYSYHAEHKARLRRLNMRAPEAGPLVLKPKPKVIAIVDGKQVIPKRDWLFLSRYPQAVRLPPTTQSQIKQIQRAVAAKFRISFDDLISHRRTSDLVYPRHVAMYLAARLTEKSYPEIGRLFGRDHTVILYAFRKIEARRLSDPDLDSKITELEQELAAGGTQ